MDAFTRGYLTAALWTEDPDPGQGEYCPDLSRISRAFRLTAVKDCARFQYDNCGYLAHYQEQSGRDMESAGHDFWLSRNGHGAGYFDRPTSGTDPAPFDRLQAAARATGEVCAYWHRGRLTV
jgi:hypothetical protein